MKDFSKQELECNRPAVSAKKAVSHCLNLIYDDKNKSINDMVVNGLSYEELIGALLLSKDIVDNEHS